MNSYPSYQTIDLPWLKCVPSHWKCDKAKRFFENPKVLNKGNFEKNVLSLTLKGVIRNNAERPIGLSPSDYSTYQLFDKDELVFKLIDLENVSTSRVGVVWERGIMSSAYIRFRMKKPENIRYFYYQYYDWYKRLIFNGLGAGVRQTLSASDLLNLAIAVPPKNEQDRIVRYLDWQVSKINKLIVAKKKQISLLHEQKQRIVNDAVFHGINCDTAFKNIDKPFVDKVPAHWKVIRGKYLLAEHDIRSMHGTEELLSVSHITGVTPRSQKNITMFKSESLVGYKICTVDDIAANTMWLWQGAIAVSNYHGVISPSYNTYHQINGSYDRRYLDYLLRARPMVEEYRMNSTGVRKSRLRLYPSQFLAMLFPVPPMEEQIQIADYISDSSKALDAFVDTIMKEIDVLHELCARIIYDVVTGQVDVRDVEVPEFEYVEEIEDSSEDDEEAEDESEDEEV